MNQPPSFAHPAFTGLIGVGRSDITPPSTIYARNWGAARHDAATGIHRPLTATALTLQQNAEDTPCVIVALDLGWWRTPEDERTIRYGLIEALSLDADKTLLHLSHTHAGPGLCPDDADKPGGALIAPYLHTVREGVISAVRSALLSATEATLEWGIGHCSLACNRDLPDPNGQPGQAQRYVVGANPAQPADDTLLVGRITAAGGAPLAVLVNYACHPTTLAWDNSLISPDYVGAMREVVEIAAGAPCLFLQGASGDLGPREGFVGDTAIADNNGRQLGLAVVAALAAMLSPRTRLHYSGTTESGAPIGSWARVAAEPSRRLGIRQLAVPLPLKAWPSAAAIEAEAATCTDRALAERLARKARVRASIGDGDTYMLPVWLWQLGDATLVAYREEAYSALQQRLRALAPGSAVIVMNLTNGSCGYLPPAELYEENIYTVWQTPYDRGCLEALADAVIAAMEADATVNA